MAHVCSAHDAYCPQCITHQWPSCCAMSSFINYTESYRGSAYWEGVFGMAKGSRPKVHHVILPGMGPPDHILIACLSRPMCDVHVPYASRKSLAMQWCPPKTKGCTYLQTRSTDEHPHQILSYTLPFSLFLCFLYIADPPLCTKHWHDYMWLHSLHRTGLTYLMDTCFMIHMFYFLS